MTRSSKTGGSPRGLTTGRGGASRASTKCPTLVTVPPSSPSTCFPLDSERSSSTMSRNWKFDDAEQEILRRDCPRCVCTKEEGTGRARSAAGDPRDEPQRQAQVRGERVNLRLVTLSSSSR